VHVYTKADGITVEVVNGVEVLEESVSNEEEVFILSGQTALMDNEVTLLMAGLIKVLLWVNLKYVVTHLESYWLNLGSDVFAALFHMAKCFIRCAVEVWQCLGPFRSDFFENIWGN